jgi:uroporphyrinogen-III synthase
LFASGSAVRGWVDVLGTQAPAVTVAIGPSTAQVAANLGLKIDVVAADHSLDGLVDGLVAYFADAV